MQCEINKVNTLFLFSPLCVGKGKYVDMILGEKVLVFGMKFLVQTRDDCNIRTIGWSREDRTLGENMRN